MDFQAHDLQQRHRPLGFEVDLCDEEWIATPAAAAAAAETNQGERDDVCRRGCRMTSPRLAEGAAEGSMLHQGDRANLEDAEPGDRAHDKSSSQSTRLHYLQLVHSQEKFGRHTKFFKAQLPCTALSVLVKNGVFPEPFLALNNKGIPDIGEVGRDAYTMWYFRSFETPNDRDTCRIRLCFRGINYRARAFLNGHELDMGRFPEGMFLRREVDITSLVKKGSRYGCQSDRSDRCVEKQLDYGFCRVDPVARHDPRLSKDSSNRLAVIVYPPNNPGIIPVNGGQGGDHSIAYDVTAQYTEGWDWMTPIRDRNTGIWDKCYLHVSGPICLRDPHITTHLRPAEISSTNGGCRLRENGQRVSQSLGNKSLEAVVRVRVTLDGAAQFIYGSLDNVELQARVFSLPRNDENRPEEMVTSQAIQGIKIMNGSRTEVKFEMTIPDVRLWWPNGMGPAHLYRLDLLVFNGNGQFHGPPYQSEGSVCDTAYNLSLSDKISEIFGCRDLNSYIDPTLKARVFVCNGQRLFIRGGNWIVADGMLRNLDSQTYEKHISLIAHAGLNMIRIWGGSIAERPEFYAACDRHGVLVWQEFWITGDNNGRGAGDCNAPSDHALFLASARDTVRLLRNHPSLALWVGGNECRPPADIDEALSSDIIPNMDGTRPYICGSLWGGFGDGKGGVQGFKGLGDGPYGIQDPVQFFRKNFIKHGFNPEIGSVGVGEFDSVAKSLGTFGLQQPQLTETETGFTLETVNSLWTYHKMIAYGDPNSGVQNQIYIYGKPASTEEYCFRAQIANFVQYRALFEAHGSAMWTKCTGVLLWKIQNPWPGLRGQLYDFFLGQTGGLYGAKTALMPQHVQLNLSTMAIELVNTSNTTIQNHLVTVRAITPAGTDVWGFHIPVSKVVSHSTSVVFQRLPNLPEGIDVIFLELGIRNQEFNHVDRNVYWLHKSAWERGLKPSRFQPVDEFHSLGKWASTQEGQAQLCVTASEGCKKLSVGPIASAHQVIIEVECQKASCVAFFVRLEIRRNSDDSLVNPCLFSENYFTLMPGQAHRVIAEYSAELKSDTVYLRVEGFNLKRRRVDVQ